MTAANEPPLLADSIDHANRTFDLLEQLGLVPPAGVFGGQVDARGGPPAHTDEEIEDEHFPWHYTEFGVVCACGASMNSHEECPHIDYVGRHRSDAVGGGVGFYSPRHLAVQR